MWMVQKKRKRGLLRCTARVLRCWQLRAGRQVRSWCTTVQTTFSGVKLKMELPIPTVIPKRQFHLQLRSEEHTSELQSRGHLVCRLLLEKKKKYDIYRSY